MVLFVDSDGGVEKLGELNVIEETDLPRMRITGKSKVKGRKVERRAEGEGNRL